MIIGIVMILLAGYGFTKFYFTETITPYDKDEENVVSSNLNQHPKITFL
ncbi:MAG: hypothetical protein V4501_02950 [Pseudomonadota bacterium]